MALKKQGFQLPPIVAPLPGTEDVAWLGVLPTASPALTAGEERRVRAIRDAAVDQRVKDRAQAILSGNGTP